MAFTPAHLALTAFEVFKSPGAMTRAIGELGAAGMEERFATLATPTQKSIEVKAQQLESAGATTLIFTQDGFPRSLIVRGRPVAPILFAMGNLSLLERTGVGLCGSRKASALGLKAATACGEEVSTRGLVVVSGYAKGVDTAAHLAALDNDGSTIIVLAEGIDHFRIKRDYAASFRPDRTLVLSQFSPSQPWGAYAAMARNKVIFGLGDALVVIEAGERGGTLAAGEGALKAGRLVYVVDFGQETPAGNRHLIGAGAIPIRSRSELGDRLARHIGRVPGDQEPLFD